MAGVGAARLTVLLRPSLAGTGPAYAAIAAGLRGLALDGRLPPGARLPSERELAAVLGLSRTTVTAAYDVLRADGYLHSARGAGSRVALPAGRPARPEAAVSSGADRLDLTVAALPAPAVLLDAVTEAAADLRPLLAGHGLHPLGLPDLREAIAAHLSARGLRTTVEQILVTNGALHGWDLLLRSLTRPGDRVLVEEPTYPAVLDAVVAHRLRAVPLPVDSEGWDRTVRAGAAKVAHLTPDFHNPTGFHADSRRRRAVLAALRGAVVVADETFVDVGHPDAPDHPPLASLGPGVVTLGSMSKAFWAGLRIGWVRAEPELVLRLAQSRAGQDLAGPVLDQLVAVRMLARSAEVLPARRRLLQQQRDALVAAMAEHLPTWQVAVPRGGMVLWYELPGAFSTRLATLGQQDGIRLTAGPRFTLGGHHDRRLRLPFTMPASSAGAVAAALAGLVAQLDDVGATTVVPSRWTA
jgi:DNA-binding transcriptional MocR family regulator